MRNIGSRRWTWCIRCRNRPKSIVYLIW